MLSDTFPTKECHHPGHGCCESLVPHISHQLAGYFHRCRPLPTPEPEVGKRSNPANNSHINRYSFFHQFSEPSTSINRYHPMPLFTPREKKIQSPSREGAEELCGTFHPLHPWFGEPRWNHVNSLDIVYLRGCGDQDCPPSPIRPCTSCHVLLSDFGSILFPVNVDLLLPSREPRFSL
ncbi:hypothetical protein BO78DRAFT_128759 [Aspergillus sclerotiicarbonarius CBS 121057]|uniref:Uncharacterized protein n=1 Tax=Aspergillus sclerotiicarbonarius (strain CBS 121057 / IBT 28362) TaxID=1448318 RepID=A0A319FGI7_ASPSB|nr:hypothetical protein BO78DRAFT_128759 [Aspergillus sclerotiicarbonarius CBS 121057]